MSVQCPSPKPRTQSQSEQRNPKKAETEKPSPKKTETQRKPEAKTESESKKVHVLMSDLPFPIRSISFHPRTLIPSNRNHAKPPSD